MEYKKVVKYIEIKNDIIEAIKAGTLQPGDKIDSESVIKKRYNVSTITVRKAFTDLINEGYLYGKQGVGTFVAKRQMVRGLTSISFSDKLVQQGYKIDMKVVGVKIIQDESIAQTLGIDLNSQITCVERIHLANDEPIAYQTSYVSADLLGVKDAESLKDTKSFYKTLADVGVVPRWANENYSIKEITDKAVADYMNVKKGASSFFVKRFAYNNQDEMVEYSETYFNKDWYSVTVNIKI